MTKRRKPLRSHGRRRYPERRLLQMMMPWLVTLHPTKGWRFERKYKTKYLKVASE